MLLSSQLDVDGSRCRLSYEESDQWLRATWSGFVGTPEAMHGAAIYLAKVGPLRCAYLLNDNVALQGPWFDSVEWLARAWLPYARQLGLRYVAHVVQADTGTDLLSLTFPEPVVGALELQLFYRVSEAEDWLRHCQQRG